MTVGSAEISRTLTYGPSHTLTAYSHWMALNGILSEGCSEFRHPTTNFTGTVEEHTIHQSRTAHLVVYLNYHDHMTRLVVEKKKCDKIIGPLEFLLITFIIIQQIQCTCYNYFTTKKKYIKIILNNEKLRNDMMWYEMIWYGLSFYQKLSKYAHLPMHFKKF